MNLKGGFVLVPRKPDCLLSSHVSAMLIGLTGDVAFIRTVNSFSDFLVDFKRVKDLTHLFFGIPSDVFVFSRRIMQSGHSLRVLAQAKIPPLAYGQLG